MATRTIQVNEQHVTIPGTTRTVRDVIEHAMQVALLDFAEITKRTEGQPDPASRQMHEVFTAYGEQLQFVVDAVERGDVVILGAAE